jgi:hypothetical protein
MHVALLAGGDVAFVNVEMRACMLEMLACMRKSMHACGDVRI